MKTTYVAVFVLAVLVSMSTKATAAPIYHATEIGQPISGWTTYVTGMNDQGVIVGWCMEPSNAATRGFVWSNGTFRFLDDLGGSYTRVNAINNKNQVVGQYRSDNFYVFVYQNGTMSDLGMDTGGIPYGINDSGVIVGKGSLNMKGNFYWNGTRSILPALSGDTGAMASGINNNNIVVGRSYGGSNPMSAVRWVNGVASSLGLTGQSYATAINDSGQIIGAGGDLGGFLWDEGNLTYYSGQLAAINNNGQIVGGNLLIENGQTFDINNLLNNTATSSLNGASAINNVGQIAGVEANGSIFILTPVPEPTTLGLLSFGLLALLRRRRA